MDYKKWINEKKAKKLVDTLKDKGYNAKYAEDIKQAKSILFYELLPKHVSVGLGGSETLAAMDILPILRNGDYDLFDRYNCDNHFEVCRDSLMADYFITGTNAITKDGELVNLDCSGSRTAAIMYGPRKVIIVIGINKLVDTIEDGIKRARSIAPMNCKRVKHKTPCAETGFCTECNDKHRMCNHIGITLNAQKFENRLNIIVINEELGF